MSLNGLKPLFGGKKDLKVQPYEIKDQLMCFKTKNFLKQTEIQKNRNENFIEIKVKIHF